MSHITVVKTQIRDIEALRTALERLGCTLEGPGSVHGYYGSMGQADFIIRVPGTRYTVGLVRQPDGTYALHADLWGGHVERVLGPGYGRLLQEYALEVVTRAARLKNRAVRVERLEDGRIRVRVAGE